MTGFREHLKNLATFDLNMNIRLNPDTSPKLFLRFFFLFTYYAIYIRWFSIVFPYSIFNSISLI
jgi:hypothetical protein